ncbi:hypothetical protein [Nesterenkonia sandarakina]|uniref:Outer membrane receptor for Fe3+-dicitrate n=1 Tax=Nesterenkonia sandarakina TaxID=272918 RepID=A0A7Z0E6T0_9MICC|nr:hypothetical protein [Nesterenkonia sandarakina]NYJ15991.1 outer membrane receptor for Fe3+-dicitrate [Nesterenkonia sandarakina]
MPEDEDEVLVYFGYHRSFNPSLERFVVLHDGDAETVGAGTENEYSRWNCIGDETDTGIGSLSDARYDDELFDINISYGDSPLNHADDRVRDVAISERELEFNAYSNAAGGYVSDDDREDVMPRFIGLCGDTERFVMGH